MKIPLIFRIRFHEKKIERLMLFPSKCSCLLCIHFGCSVFVFAATDAAVGDSNKTHAHPSVHTNLEMVKNCT